MLVEDVQRRRLQPVIRKLCLGFYSLFQHQLLLYTQSDAEAGFSIFVCLYLSFPTITPTPQHFQAVRREAWLTARSLGEGRGGETAPIARVPCVPGETLVLCSSLTCLHH